MRGRDKDLGCADRRSPATGMHFQVRIAAELIDPDQLAVPQSDRFQRLAGFSASIAPGATRVMAGSSSWRTRSPSTLAGMTMPVTFYGQVLFGGANSAVMMQRMLLVAITENRSA